MRWIASGWRKVKALEAKSGASSSSGLTASAMKALLENQSSTLRDELRGEFVEMLENSKDSLPIRTGRDPKSSDGKSRQPMTEAEARRSTQKKVGTSGRGLEDLEKGDWAARLAGRMSLDEVDGLVKATVKMAEGSKSTKLEAVLAWMIKG